MQSGICILTRYVFPSLTENNELVTSHINSNLITYLTYCDKKTWKFAFEHRVASSLLQQIPFLVLQNSDNLLELK